VASCGESGRVVISDVDSGRTIKELIGHTSRTWDLAWSPVNGRIASGSADLTVRVWDDETGECVAILADFTDPVYNVRFSPDGKHLFTNSSGTEFVKY